MYGERGVQWDVIVRGGERVCKRMEDQQLLCIGAMKWITRLDEEVVSWVMGQTWESWRNMGWRRLELFTWA